MEDSVIKSIFDAFKERQTNPLFRSFIFSWVIWNYEFFLIIFSSEIYEEKIYLINNLFDQFLGLPTGWWWQPINVLVTPLAASIIYIYYFPHLSLPFFEKSLDSRNEFAKVRLEKDGKRPVEQSVHDNMVIENARTQKEKEERIEDLTKQIEALNITIAGMETDSRLDKEILTKKVEAQEKQSNNRSLGYEYNATHEDDKNYLIGEYLNSLVTLANGDHLDMNKLSDRWVEVYTFDNEVVISRLFLLEYEKKKHFYCLVSTWLETKHKTLVSHRWLQFFRDYVFKTRDLSTLSKIYGLDIGKIEEGIGALQNADLLDNEEPPEIRPLGEQFLNFLEKLD